MSAKSVKKAKGLRNIDELIPPEGVPLKLEIAGIGVRLVAQITDILITLVGMIAILVLLGVLNLTEPSTLMAIAMMLFFVIRVPYYCVSEILWNGQTLGKRLMKIKVVSNDGKSLGAHALVVRNLMKEAEIFLPGTLVLSLDRATPFASGAAMLWVLMVLMVPLFNRRRRRLGDMIAGTYVIHLPTPVLLKDLSRDALATKTDGKKIAFLSHHLDHYGTFELQTLEGLLRAQDRRPDPAAAHKQRETVAAIVEKIRRKIDYADLVQPGDRVRFLRAFYNAQRAHLEQRQLFGERRADKHHAKQGENT